jgi:hypothetical protein
MALGKSGDTLLPPRDNSLRLICFCIEIDERAARSDRMNDGRSYIWHPVLIVLFLTTAYLAVNILAERRNPSALVHGDVTIGILLILLVTVVLFVLEVVGCSIALYRRASARAIWQALAIVVLASSIAFDQSVALAVQYVDLLVFPGVFETCMQQAKPYRVAGSFNICSAQSFGSSFSIIVYDTGGEISLPAAQRSSVFKGLLSAQKSPLPSQCKAVQGRHLHDAFYLVDAGCDSRPDE